MNVKKLLVMRGKQALVVLRKYGWLVGFLAGCYVGGLSVPTPPLEDRVVCEVEDEVIPTGPNFTNYGAIAAGDINSDGLANCIDAAMSFYDMAKGSRYNPQIMYGQSYDRKTAHLWIRVAGVDIQPFAEMTYKYDPSTVENLTHYARYIRENTFNWDRVHMEDKLGWGSGQWTGQPKSHIDQMVKPPRD